MRFVGLALQDAVPDAKTIWLDRGQLPRAGALAGLFARFDAMLAERGFLAMGGQIVDATIVEARRPRLTKEEKATLRCGGTPEGWSKARTRQIDRDGRWTLKRGRKAKPPGGSPHQATVEIAMPMFGYKNHLGVDRAHGFIRRFVVTDAARHDGAQSNTGSGVWADTAYRSKANLDLLDRRGLRPEFQRAKPRGRPMPVHIARGNATRARVRSRVEHVFATEKRGIHPGKAAGAERH
jgi:transposase, IS5 family